MQPSTAVTTDPSLAALPDHTQLPDKDGDFVRNFQEPPQSTLLTGSFLPRLVALYPDGQFCIGCDSGIYWRYTQPVLDGCKSPDWFLIPGVPPMLEGRYRRSYVLWQEAVRPLLVIEYVSGDGSEERDQTPYKGKFWVYEKAIGAGYYAIFEAAKPAVELYRLEEGRYVPVPPNGVGRFPVPALRVELGIWHGTYQGQELPWLRLWDADTGQLMPSTEEREAAERQRADGEKARADTAESLLDDSRRLLQEECERAETERKRAEQAESSRQQLAEKLRSLGIDPDTM
jgi:Uma2 family endonuclease